TAATRVELVGDDFVRRRVPAQVNLGGLDERQFAERGFFVERAFFLAFPVEREVRVHLLFPRAEFRRAQLEAVDQQFVVLRRFVAPQLLVADLHGAGAARELAGLGRDRHRPQQANRIVAADEWLEVDVDRFAGSDERELVVLTRLRGYRAPPAAGLGGVADGD